MFDILPSIFRLSLGTIKLFPIDIQIYYYTHAQKISKIIGGKEISGDIVDEMLMRHRNERRRIASSIRGQIQDLEKRRENYLEEQKKDDPDSKIKSGTLLLLLGPFACFVFQDTLDVQLSLGIIVLSLMIGVSLIVSGLHIYTDDRFRRQLDWFRNEEIRLKSMLIRAL